MYPFACSVVKFDFRYLAPSLLVVLFLAVSVLGCLPAHLVAAVICDTFAKLFQEIGTESQIAGIKWTHKEPEATVGTAILLLAQRLLSHLINPAIQRF